ncbi:hypothetical protein C8Q76DRAFT_618301 [Earliella scabrosa]|nr:hypothetical protein C8Q76DRAFT_618301 [Earliella scabrosa]
MVLRPVPRGGKFIGSVASLFRTRAAADIHLENFWHTIGPMRRVCFWTKVWGGTIIIVERAYRAEDGAEPTQYEYYGNGLTMLNVEDHGQQFADREDVPNILPDDFNADYEIEGEFYPALAVPWHREITVRKSQDHPSPFHYHQARRRWLGRNDAPKPRPQNKGSHWSFKSLLIRVQVQSSRRAMPT